MGAPVHEFVQPGEVHFVRTHLPTVVEPLKGTYESVATRKVGVPEEPEDEESPLEPLEQLREPELFTHEPQLLEEPVSRAPVVPLVSPVVLSEAEAKEEVSLRELRV